MITVYPEGWWGFAVIATMLIGWLVLLTCSITDKKLSAKKQLCVIAFFLALGIGLFAKESCVHNASVQEHQDQMAKKHDITKVEALN